MSLDEILRIAVDKRLHISAGFGDKILG